MKWFSLLMLFPGLCFAELQVENGEVLPFKYDNTPVAEVVGDFAASMEKLIVSNVKFRSRKIHFSTNKRIKVSELEQILANILKSQGFSLIEQGGFLTIFNSREVRYMPFTLFNSNEIPESENHAFVYHEMKYPLASSVARSMRPFMTRWGRIISFSDGHSITISDNAKNIKRLIQLINSFDSKKAYDSLISGKRKKRKKENYTKENLQIEILELEKEKLKKELGFDDPSYHSFKINNSFKYKPKKGGQ